MQSFVGFVKPMLKGILASSFMNSSEEDYLKTNNLMYDLLLVPVLLFFVQKILSRFTPHPDITTRLNTEDWKVTDFRISSFCNVPMTLAS
jgi:hypothetical protein